MNIRFFAMIAVCLVVNMTFWGCDERDPEEEKRDRIMRELFPCEHFRMFVLEHFDKNKDRLLDEAERNAVTSIELNRETNVGTLWVNGRNEGLVALHIQSFEGIEHFPNLREFIIDDGFQSFDIDMPEFDVSKNPELRRLYIRLIMFMEKLDLSKNTKLTHLDVCVAAMTNFDLRANTELEWLHIIRIDKMNTIDLRANTKLRYLGIGTTFNENLTFDLSRNEQLTEMRVVGIRQTTNLDLSTATRLQRLYCTNNPNLRTLDISRCTELIWLNIYANSELREVYVWQGFDVNNPPENFRLTDGRARYVVK